MNRKFIIGTAAGLVASSLVFLLLYIPLYQSELTEEGGHTAWQINSLLQTSLENAMLKRDLPGLTQMVQKLGEQPGIVSVVITNPAGEIRFTSTPERLGRMLTHPYTAQTPTTRFLKDEQEKEVLRSINPVHNKPPCTECHGPIEKSPINGILYVDYDAAPLRSKVQHTTLLLMGAGSLIVILNLTGGWWFIRHYILKPVEQLTQTSEAMAKGDLMARVSMSGKDELSRLGSTFNSMAVELQNKLRELEEQKLSELGRLATGVAHEIHNPLASVKLALDATEKAIASHHDCPDSIMDYLRLVDHEIENCIQITGKLLKLGAPPTESLELVDINAALHETLSLLRWQAEQNNIQINECLDDSLLRALASDGELRMVALNLAQNAFHAMPVGGELIVSTTSRQGRIIIQFADTGAGILVKDLPYIFDPFFSRRADDAKGTGLGLSISLAIVEKYGGTIDVESKFSGGSVFTIDLPDASQKLGGQI